MSIVPRVEDIHKFVGSVQEWMDSVGVSWEDAYAFDCSDCYRIEDEDFPWNCPNPCPNKQFQLTMKIFDMEDNWAPFWESIVSQQLRTSPDPGKPADELEIAKSGNQTRRK